MKGKEKMKEKTKISYIAGIFDGEGSVFLTKRKSGKIRINVSITNTNLNVLKYVKQNIGLGRILKSIDSRANYPIYMWRTSDGYAYKFLKIVYPYLIIKKSKSDETIKLYESNKWKKIKENVENVN